MGVLLGGVAGSSSRMSGGIITAPPRMVSDVQPVAMQIVPKSLGPRVGKFRRSIKDVTQDGTGAALGDCDVHCFRTSDDVEVDQQPSDASGNFEVSVYDDGPFYCKAEKPIISPRRFYFHTETTLSGAPTAPTGSRTLSELPPDQTDGAAASIAGGHLSTSTGAVASLLNKPTTKDETGVAGLPPVVGTPAAAHQFGWFSDVQYTGTFAVGQWTFQWREDDDTSGIVGRAVLNIFASTTRDFANMRFLGQLEGLNDWWQGAVQVAAWISEPWGPLVLNGEYLFVQLWCNEVSGFAGGKTLTFHQEGSDLAESARSSLLTTPYNPAATHVAGVTDNTLVGV